MDWPAILHIGLSKMGLRPDILWQLSPKEFWLMGGFEKGHAICSRAKLERLCQQFPDREGKNDR